MSIAHNFIHFACCANIDIVKETDPEGCKKYHYYVPKNPV
jgi:hypothetical protein